MALDEKTALVTGAGRGIGEATAIELAKAGADVAVTDLDGDAADETSAKIESLGRRSLAILADFGNLSDILGEGRVAMSGCPRESSNLYVRQV